MHPTSGTLSQPSSIRRKHASSLQRLCTVLMRDSAIRLGRSSADEWHSLHSGLRSASVVTTSPVAGTRLGREVEEMQQYRQDMSQQRRQPNQCQSLAALPAAPKVWCASSDAAGHACAGGTSHTTRPVKGHGIGCRLGSRVAEE